MSLRISFELQAEDLTHLRKLMKQAQEAAASCDKEQVIEGARTLLANAQSTSLPSFMRERFLRLEMTAP